MYPCKYSKGKNDDERGRDVVSTTLRDILGKESHSWSLTSFIMQSGVFTFSEGNALAHSCTPNKQSCIYQRQDNTILIWTTSSFSCSPTSPVLLVHPWKIVAQHRTKHKCTFIKNVHVPNTNTLPYTHILMTALPLPWCHSLGSFFADVEASTIKCLGSNQH